MIIVKKFLFVTTAALAFASAPALAAPAAEAAQPVETVRIAPSEAKMALAREAVDLMYPAGQSEYVVNYMVGPYADYMLKTPLSQLAEDFGVRESVTAFSTMMPMLAEQMGEEFSMPEEMNPEAMAAMVDMMVAMVGDKTLEGMIAGEDEHFAERVSIVRGVLRERMPAISSAFDAPVRDALAKIFAQKFSDSELAEIGAFADTPAGAKFARTYLVAQFEPAYYGGIMQAVPSLVPQAMPLFEDIKARTAHLPPLFPETLYCEDLEEGDERECVEAEEEVELTPEQQAQELEEEAAMWEQEAADLRAEAAKLRAQ